jgi:hypothetical protein
MGEAKKMGQIAYSWYATTVEFSHLRENVLDPNQKKRENGRQTGPKSEVNRVEQVALAVSHAACRGVVSRQKSSSRARGPGKKHFANKCL